MFFKMLNSQSRELNSEKWSNKDQQTLLSGFSAFD